MSVIYACVAYKNTPLAHRGKTDKIEKQFAGNVEKILENFVDKDNMRTSQSQDNMNFYVLLQNQMTYLCFCDVSVTKGAAYGFLNDICNAFSSKYSLSMAKTAVKFQMDREFGSTMAQKMDNIKTYQSAQTADLLQELDETKGLIMNNVD